jgi:hypothetical protein
MDVRYENRPVAAYGQNIGLHEFLCAQNNSPLFSGIDEGCVTVAGINRDTVVTMDA